MITYPTFDERGGISMGEVMSASFEDFAEDASLDVPGMLEEALAALEERRGTPTHAVSDVAHLFIERHETIQGHQRTPGYQHSAHFCLAWKLYVFLSNETGMRTSDAEEDRLRFAIEKLTCELSRVRGESKLMGQCPEPLPIQRGDTVSLPKGTPYTTTKENGVQVTKRKRTVKVALVGNGYYCRGVHNPRVSWAGRGGYWCDVEMRYVTKVS